MTRKTQFDGLRREQGSALLIAIFALLLVSVVAIALIVSSGTDTALARNYRTSTNAYYAALAGVEEARGRLLLTSPNCIPLPTNANCVQPQPPPPMPPMPLTQVVYIINPAGGEVVAPDDTANPTTYPDTQYKQEFGVDVSTRVVTKYASVSPVAGLPGPEYKWVRINAVTEQSMGNGAPGTDINNDGTVDAVTPLFYDPENRTAGNVMAPGLIETAVPPVTASQVLEITSYAVLPSGGQKMLQYIVRPMVIFPDLNNQSFPAALTIAGSNVTYTGPGTSSFNIRGQDQCTTAAIYSVGYTQTGGGDSSRANIIAGATPTGNYQGQPMSPGPPPTPSTGAVTIADVSAGMNPNWLTPTGLDAVVQDITNNADAVITGPATPGSFPSGMSATHPMTIVVNGDLSLSGWHNTGYGLLLVTGTLYYDPDATWEGVVLVIGQGNFVSTRGGTSGIDGAVFIAKTRNAAGSLLASLGASNFSQTGPGSNVGTGINYSSCTAQAAEGPITYKVIAFKEIPLAN